MRSLGQASSSEDRAEAIHDGSLSGSQHTSPVGKAAFVKSESVAGQSRNFMNINRGHIPSGSETYQLVLRELSYSKHCHTDMDERNGIKPGKSSIKSPGWKGSRCQVQWADKTLFCDKIKITREKELPQPSED